MLEMYRAILEGLRKYPLATVCAILIGVVGHLWLNNGLLRDRIEAKDLVCSQKIVECVNEKIAMERRCAAILDSILRAELRKTEAQNNEMEKIIKQAKRR